MLNPRNRNLKIFAGHSNPKLAKDISDKIGVSIGNCSVKTFSDGEFALNNRDNVHGQNVFIIQSTSGSVDEDGRIRSVNDNLIELLMMGRSAKCSGASKVTAVIPYFGYARQDRKVDPRDCITAQLAANLIEHSGFDAALLLDLHAQQIQGFFSRIMVHGITGRYIIYDYFREKLKSIPKENVVVVSPDAGSFKNSDKLAEELGIPIVSISKRRKTANQSEVAAISGDPKGKVCLIRDDMIDTAGTLCGAAKALEEAGAKEIYVAATHGVLSGQAIERLQASPITELALMETIAIPPEKRIAKMRFLPTADILAENIVKIHMGYDLNAPLP